MLDYQFLKTNIFNIVNVDAQKVLNSIEDDEENCGDKTTPNPRKRKRLDDFTPQERMIRRKLKNRAAAQHARDRKKERMDHLEKVVSQLEVENKELKRSNEELRTNMHALMAQNQELLDHLRKGDKENVNKKDTPLQRVPEMGTDHTYFAKIEPDVEVTSIPLVVEEDNQVVIKKEEESEDKHAAEITDPSCFLNHDVVNQSEINQLLDVFEYIESGESVEGNDSTESGTEIETEEFEGNTSAFTNESCPNTGGVSEEETNELLELCQEIQNIVREAEPDSVTIPDTTVCVDQCSNKNRVVEKIYIDVEDEKNYDDNVTDVMTPVVDISNSDVNIDVLETIDESSMDNSSLNNDTDSHADVMNGIDNTSDNYSKLPLCDMDLFKSADLLNEFDTIINSYQPLDTLDDSHNSQSTADLNVQEDWGDLMNDLFPSLSSL